MLSSIKRVLMTLFILTAAAILGIYFYTKDRTYYNDDSLIGNTIGNIYNGGLFGEQGNIIYFSYDAKGGKLYSMTPDCTGLRKVADEKAVYINVDENYIYYARANSSAPDSSDFYSIYNNNGVYRINKNGKELKAFTGDPGAFLMLKGNFLYFERYSANEGFNLTRFKIDKTMERILVYDSAVPILSDNKFLYYIGNSEGKNIKSLNLSSFTEKIYYKGDFAYPIFMNHYIYYIDRTNKNHIYRMNSDGSNKTLLIKKPCSTYNITNSGKFLYYQVSGTKKDYIGRIDLKSLKSQIVKKGDYKQINVTQFYVFFKDVDSKNTYLTLADQSINVAPFKPKK